MTSDKLQARDVYSKKSPRTKVLLWHGAAVGMDRIRQREQGVSNFGNRRRDGASSYGFG